MIKLEIPQHFSDYEFIDSGEGLKLERFGNLTLARPEPQAIWTKRLSQAEWDKLTDAEFDQNGSHKGQWKFNKGKAKPWFVKYHLKQDKIKFKLNFTSFKHVGIFPEQAVNWDYIYYKTTQFRQTPSVLNLFAYTGGASLAARAAGADVVHVDSVKQVVSWSNENQELSGLSGIRWVVEDALKFVKREVKRGKVYQGIILDPPAYGIGAKGERWKLEEKLAELLSEVSKLLSPDSFLVLNVYSLGLSPYILRNLMQDYFNKFNFEILELGLESRTGQILPLGIIARI